MWTSRSILDLMWSILVVWFQRELSLVLRFNVEYPFRQIWRYLLSDWKSAWTLADIILQYTFYPVWVLTHLERDSFSFFLLLKCFFLLSFVFVFKIVFVFVLVFVFLFDVNLLTLTKTSGNPGLAHPDPNDVIPARYHRPS